MVLRSGMLCRLKSMKCKKGLFPIFKYDLGPTIDY